MSGSYCKGSYALGSACGRCDKCREVRAKNGWSSHDEALIRGNILAKVESEPIRSESAPIIPDGAPWSSRAPIAHLREIAAARREQTDVMIAHIEAAISAAESPAVIDALMDLAKKVLA